MASQRRRAARPTAVRALVTSVMVGGSGEGQGQRIFLAQCGRRGVTPSPSFLLESRSSGALLLEPFLPQTHPLPPGPAPLSCARPGGAGDSQLTVTSTRRLSGAELTPLCVTHSYSPAWPRWMSEISRISPSEVKPSVGGGEGRGRGRTQTLNTGQNGHNTDRHQRGGQARGLGRRGQWGGGAGLGPGVGS